jgi:TorA maturation chaperone TorD
MKESSDFLCQRAESYKFLSECYYLPDDGFFQKVIDAAQTDQGFSELAACISSGIELESLKIDYTRLFIGPFKLLAPPYGSVYLEDNRMMGDSTIDVRNCYENEGLDIVIKDAPDHIAMELEFMYYLAVKQIEAVKDANLEILQSCQQKQYSFLRTHLSRWLPAFAENVQKNAQTEFTENWLN